MSTRRGSPGNDDWLLRLICLNSRLLARHSDDSVDSPPPTIDSDPGLANRLSDDDEPPSPMDSDSDSGLSDDDERPPFLVSDDDSGLSDEDESPSLFDSDSESESADGLSDNSDPDTEGEEVGGGDNPDEQRVGKRQRAAPRPFVQEVVRNQQTLEQARSYSADCPACLPVLALGTLSGIYWVAVFAFLSDQLLSCLFFFGPSSVGCGKIEACCSKSCAF